MITGAHVIIYSANPDADRAFLRDVLRLTNVDVGGGWLIFGLPPSEVAVHPADRNNVHELYFMCDDIEAFVSDMQRQHIACDPVKDQGWGLLAQVGLPGGGKLGVYQPRHARPETVVQRPSATTSGKRAMKGRTKKFAGRLKKRLKK